MKGIKWTGECAVNLFLLLISTFYLSYSLANYDIGSLRMPEEGFMPMLVGAGSVLISAVLTVQAFRGKGDAQNVKFNISWPRFFLLLGISLAYALLLNTLGYMLASFLFLLAVLRIAGVEGWIKPLYISLGCSVAFYIIFKVALGVMLPSGFLGL